jgi:hypothetical protein
MRFFFSLLAVATLGHVAFGSSYELEVEHRRVGADTHGRLLFTEEAVEFTPTRHPDQQRSWNYQDVQELRIEGKTDLRIATYKDQVLRLNRPETYRFRVVEGEIPPELTQFLRLRLSTPLVSALFLEPEEIEYRVAVKHRHGLGGGCEGVLSMTEDAVYFTSDREDHSRSWPLAQIEGLGTVSRFDLRLTTQEGAFHFRLKEPLPEGMYDRLWQRLFLPQTWLPQ